MPFDAPIADQPISAEAALIAEAMSLISDKRHWCQGRMRRRGQNGPQYCMMGAIRQASGKRLWTLGQTERNVMKTLRKECKGLGFRGITTLNDLSCHSVVLSVMRAALAKERAKELV